MYSSKTGNTLAPGDIFQVSEEQRGADGLFYLKLADGRGWVFERKPGVGVLCERLPDLEIDREGRHFINYSPALFMPLLDYLGMKETEARGQHTPLPRGPLEHVAQFDAMLRDFGIVPAAHLGEVRVLSAVAVAYSEIPWWAYGLAFEVRARNRPVLLTALETCSIARDLEGDGTVLCTVHICEGRLVQRLAQRCNWIEAGRGVLSHREPSRVEFLNTMLVREHSEYCIYIATDEVGTGRGVAFGAPTLGGVSAENGDIQLITGHFSTRFDDFSDGGFYPFNGRLEYMLPP